MMNAEILMLFNVIKRLRTRLISYGLSEKEIIHAILCNFMDLPKIDWANPSLTANYYRLKQKYKVN
jgi:hypothetical protein